MQTLPSFHVLFTTLLPPASLCTQALLIHSRAKSASHSWDRWGRIKRRLKIHLSCRRESWSLSFCRANWASNRDPRFALVTDPVNYSSSIPAGMQMHTASTWASRAKCQMARDRERSLCSAKCSWRSSRIPAPASHHRSRPVPPVQQHTPCRAVGRALALLSVPLPGRPGDWRVLRAPRVCPRQRRRRSRAVLPAERIPAAPGTPRNAVQGHPGMLSST